MAEVIKHVYTRPWTYQKQLDAIFNDSRYAIIEASTKTGKTVGCIIWLFEQAAMGAANRNYWWVAPVSQQAGIAFDRMRSYLPQEVFTANLTERYITLLNGARIWFKSADKPDSLYGEDVWAAVVDEASRVKDGAWHAVRSTLTATQGKVRIIGNVKGRKNWFYALARKAQSGEHDYTYSKLTAYDAVDAGIVRLEEVEDAKRTLPEMVFRELYLAEPSDDGGNPFGHAHINACATLERVTGNPAIIWGWDLAKSVDWTVGIALDKHGQLATMHRFQKPWPETVEAIRTATGNIDALLDSTGVGDPILDHLQQGSQGNYQGVKFTSQSKQQLMEGLASAIQHQRIKIVRDSELHRELMEFEYEYHRGGVRYSAPEGQHDDCVCALALAVSGLRSVPNNDDFLSMMDRLYG